MTGVTAGAATAGDPYFPASGNSRYRVDHYDLAVRYDPRPRSLRGSARLSVTTTKALTGLNLDLHKLKVSRATIDSAVVETFGETITFQPTLGLYAERAVIHGLRILITAYLGLLTLMASALTLFLLHREFGVAVMVAEELVVGFVFAIVVATFVGKLENRVMGTYCPAAEWSCRISVRGPNLQVIGTEDRRPASIET